MGLLNYWRHKQTHSQHSLYFAEKEGTYGFYSLVSYLVCLSNGQQVWDIIRTWYVFDRTIHLPMLIGGYARRSMGRKEIEAKN